MKSKKSGLYEYCYDCPLKFRSEREKIECGMHWRPLTGTKHGFPIDGFNCPKDSYLLWLNLDSNQS